ncbi:hypothetical protein [Nonomuraea sp. bgisy101]
MRVNHHEAMCPEAGFRRRLRAQASLRQRHAYPPAPIAGVRNDGRAA